MRNELVGSFLRSIKAFFVVDAYQMGLFWGGSVCRFM